jgi:hypothetical protein
MSRSRRPNPATKARMSRKQPEGAQPGRRPEDPKDAYSAEQLAEVGAIVLLWNQIEAFIDFLTFIALRPRISLFWDITRRLRGISARVELLRLAADRNKILTSTEKQIIKTALDGVIEYKRYRDNIAHSMPYDADKGIAHSFKYGSELVQTLVTMPALTGLYMRMKLLMDELREVDMLYRIADDDETRRPRGARHDPRSPLYGSVAPSRTALALQRQKERLSLEPLPEFPDEDEGHSLMEDTEPHERSP